MPESAVRRLIEMFEAISSVIEAERDHLSELDGAIGDADHGITMAIGFSAVTGELARTDAGSAGLSGVLTAAASSFLNAVGASTGPLYATAFRRAAQALKERDTLDLEACSLLIQAVASGIGERGKGQRGDKTMLDVWLPAADAAAQAVAAGKSAAAFWSDVTAAAENGASATRSMVATKGRAARVGERSLGHMDPGAASAVLIIRAMAQTLRDG
ncbi:dihydroxyacetone kinase, L subunit [Sinorhizobium meliloti CCNWSX0020]|uniref:Dihydroxyacetone kinase, L subunit n=2 Tax=Sinorhizobium TaxID=28105 RepID=H0FTI7_RHIML|nr:MULTISPECIES: dihydroxyacetone kinase subunit DhaL [Sinorhizobium]EHK79525.1 dihydroxyacetone kinase, L subunit [Sinorhizobium meliloti CCNWSX0020]WHS91119.1 dihydroxyacetone kinase subunit DhaL [Sinorhizobium kummerowiae]WRW49135.1 dihydroxyacetone kinase subunit DhaL [Sinorhizobium kummerowiae]